METKKLTEGALLSALQIVLGLILLPTGIGYSIYMELLLPIMMCMIFLRCGGKIAFLAGINTVVLVAFCLGDVIGAIYIGQALGFGFLCGALIMRKGSFQDDLMIASLIGCLFLLILDAVTAKLVGYSLLDTQGLDEMFAYLVPQGTQQMFEVIFYISVAAIPIASVMMTYIGGLILGKRLGLLTGEALKKQRMIQYFKFLSGHSYLSKESVYAAIMVMLLCYGCYPLVQGGYVKALLATSGLVLLYFVLMDCGKIMTRYYMDLGKHPIGLLPFKVLILIGLVNAFRVTCVLVIGLGIGTDLKRHIRSKQAAVLKYYLDRPNYLKQLMRTAVQRRTNV